MKRIKLLSTAFAAVAAVLALASCGDDNDSNWICTYPGGYYPNALVTLKTSPQGDFYMQLDDKTAIWPENIKKNPYGDKEVRALVACYTVKNSVLPDGAPAGAQVVHVDWMDSIRTKDAVPYPAADVDKTYGNDPVEIVNDWLTVAEDGYLTLRFRTLWGANGTVHYINLLTGKNPNDPYEVELRHNANGDTNGHWGDALVAFKLPEVEGADGKQVKLTLKYKSFSGEKTVTFNYQSGRPTITNNSSYQGGYSERVK